MIIKPAFLCIPLSTEGKETDMEYLHKLPFMLGTFMAIVMGIVSYQSHVSLQDTYIRMAIFMIVFFVIGIYARNTIAKIIDEISRKKETERQAELEVLRQEELGAAEAENAGTLSKFDKTIDSSYDEVSTFGENFSPLTIREFLKSSDD